MKYFIVILIILIGFLTATYLTTQIKNHTKSIQQCVLLTENIEILLKFSNLELVDLFENLLNSKNYDLLFFIDVVHKNLKSNNEFDNILKKDIFINSVSNFDEEDIALICGFFSQLGKTDINGQIQNCKLYKKLFMNKMMKLEKQQEMKCKSVSVTCIGIGIMFSIILL